MYVYVYVCIFTHISTYTNRYIDFIVYTHIEYIYVSIFICIFMYIKSFGWIYNSATIIYLISFITKNLIDRHRYLLYVFL